MTKFNKIIFPLIALILLLPFASAMFTQPDKVIQERYNPQDLNHYQFVRNNPYRYTDPNGLWTVQVGGSVTSGFGGGGTFGGGIIFGHSQQGGFQMGHYTILGGGAHAGGTASATIDFSGSLNDYIKDIGGDTLTLGGSGDFGPSIGGEVNIPLDDEEDIDITDKKKKPYIHPSGTVSVGAGVGITGGEGHAHLINTQVSQWFGGSRSSGGGMTQAVPLYVRKDGTVIWGAPGTKVPEGSQSVLPKPKIPNPTPPKPTIPKPKRVGS